MEKSDSVDRVFSSVAGRICFPKLGDAKISHNFYRMTGRMRRASPLRPNLAVSFARGVLRKRVMRIIVAQMRALARRLTSNIEQQERMRDGGH